MAIRLVMASLVALSACSDPEYLPLREPSKQSYFAPLAGHTPAFPWRNQHIPGSSILRKSNLTKAEFDKLVRSGQPFVVDDCADGWPFKEWKCEDFGRHWPSGNMKAEYSSGGRTTLGDGIWWNKLRDGARSPQHMSGGEMIAGPYIWHVKDEEPPATKRSVQKHWRSPYFFNSTAANHLEAWDSFEFWFSLPGGGAFAHSDSYCEMTISTQLRGVKTWRLMMYPTTPTVFDSFEAFDMGVYGVNKWSPEYEFEVGPGQCFLFPPGYMHETHVKPSSNPDCSVATTFQYNLPFPTKYIRSFLPRLFSSHLVWQENCHLRWHAFHSLTEAPERPTVDSKVLRSRVDTVFKLVDTNSDGHLEASELLDYLSTSPRTAWAREVQYSWTRLVSEAQVKQVQREQLEARAADTVSYNDLNHDDRVSVEELYKSTLQWNVLSYKMVLLKRLNPQSRADTQKALEIEKDFHLRYSCGEKHDPEFCLGDEYFRALQSRVRYLGELTAFQREADEEEEEERQWAHDEV